MHKLVTLTIDAPRATGEAGEPSATPGVPGGLPGQVLRGQHELCLELEIPEESAQFLVDMLLDLRQRKPGETLESLVRLAVRRRLQSGSQAPGTLFEEILGAVEAVVIGETFDQCDRIQTRTAALLGIDRNTLYKKLKLYHLLKPTGSSDSVTGNAPPT